MADLTACGFGAITPELIFRSLIGCDESTGMPAIRANLHMGEGRFTSPLKCASFEDFLILLQRSLSMGNDGHVLINVNVGFDTLTTCDDCGSAMTWIELASTLFSEDNNGQVYLNMDFLNMGE